MLILAWIVVVVTAVFLRFDDLAGRPMHADEATGARITAKRMEGDGGAFDPKHYHGPLLSDLAIVSCRMHGESEWREMTKQSLRVVTAVAGCMVVLIPLLWRRFSGDGVSLLAGALLSTSSLLSYFSRMFIHESLLVVTGMAALGVVIYRPRWGLPGLLVALMFAAKESFAISMIAWFAAAVALVCENRRRLDAVWWAKAWKEWRQPVLVSSALGAFIILLCYTHGFTHPKGAVDAVRTFFVYETVEGHDKPWDYYLRLMLVPEKAAGVLWFGTPVVMLALWAYGMSFSPRVGDQKRWLIRFLAYSTLGHLVIYSLFGYKTPWLLCLPWAQLCWLAGFAVTGFAQRPRWVQAMLGMLVAASLLTQWNQARHATGRLDSDSRNPYAYVPTRRDVERMEVWLHQLRDMSGQSESMAVAVVGMDYWPLPWYLRGFEHVGYWGEQLPENLEKFPLVLVMPAQSQAVIERLANTHVPVPRGLRDKVPLDLHISAEVWNEWMNSDTP